MSVATSYCLTTTTLRDIFVKVDASHLLALLYIPRTFLGVGVHMLLQDVNECWRLDSILS